MKIEKIKILVDEFGLNKLIDDLIIVNRYIIKGEFSFFKIKEEERKNAYIKTRKEIIEKIESRLIVIFEDSELLSWEWSFGRLSNGVCYITFLNPKWSKK